MDVGVTSSREPEGVGGRLARLLRLRAWALRVLCCGVERDGPDVPLSPPQDPDVWKTFLAHESCGAPLDAGLDEDTRRVLDARALAVLRAAATRETRLLLAARAQLQQLAGIARRLDTRIVVLKGAVCAARASRVLALEDIDILVPEARARDVAAAIDAAGYRPAGFASARHLRTRAAPERLPIDIHVTTSIEGKLLDGEVWGEIEPLADLPGLWTLSAREHAWHVLTHVAIDHLDRRGRIRDLLLLEAALGACSVPDLSELARRIEGHPLSRPLGDQLDMARALALGRPVDDWFPEVAAANYLLRRYVGMSKLPGTLGTLGWRWSFALTAGPAERRTIWRETVRRSMDKSKFGFISRVEALAPRAGAVWRYGLRIVRLPFALALAGAIALMVQFALFQMREEYRYLGGGDERKVSRPARSHRRAIRVS